MAAINLLDSDTINKIAAGEVVERPSSVVKELVENAIDAKASAITIEIKDGGVGLIRITDNGMGIEKEDIPKSFLRHSTSKIKSAEDLLYVSSLGFRGEALSSIAAVGQVELVTKTHSALLGIRYLIDGGVEKSIQEIGCPSGTTVIVRNLFYNTPARRKFLKTNMTEAGYISDLVQRLALSNPEISFKFTVNDQTKLHTMGNHQLKDIIYNIFGRDIAANIMPVFSKNDHIEISGFIGKPIINRGNRTYENYFINGRYIKSSVITKAIEEAYKTFIMVHKYPFTALHLKVNSDLIDVNVHPTKMEIRFNNNEEVYQLVYQAVRKALEAKELIPDVSIEKESIVKKQKVEEKKVQAQNMKAFHTAPEPFETMRREAFQIHEQSPQYTPVSIPIIKQENMIQKPAPMVHMPSQKSTPPVPSQKPMSMPQMSSHKAEQLELFDDKLLSKNARSRHKLIGQIFDTYWIVEYEGKMFIIDQHAAHEKVLYEKLVQKYRSRKPSSQYLNPPMILSLSLREENTVNTYLQYFKDFGFEIEHFGGNEYAVRAVPMDLFGLCEKDMVVTMIDNLASDNYIDKDDIILDRLATSACKAAVKGGHSISFKEADVLIDLLLQAENPYTCPHGRPTIISMSRYELEKKFKRIQN